MKIEGSDVRYELTIETYLIQEQFVQKFGSN